MEDLVAPWRQPPRRRSVRVLFTGLLVAASAVAQDSPAAFESPHFQGPHGLSGWTVTAIVPTLENQGPLPLQLVLARNGNIIRRIQGDHFVWKWSLLHNGRWVAYETGPLHFDLTCILVDIPSGRQLATFDCYTRDTNAPSTPAWVKQLETHGNSWAPATPSRVSH